MGLTDLVSAVAFLLRAAVAIGIGVLARGVVKSEVAAGNLPADPLGLASYGLPATLFGIPVVYVAAIGLLVVPVLFGKSGGSEPGGVADGVGDGGGGGGGDGGE